MYRLATYNLPLPILFSVPIATYIHMYIYTTLVVACDRCHNYILSCQIVPQIIMSLKFIFLNLPQLHVTCACSVFIFHGGTPRPYNSPGVTQHDYTVHVYNYMHVHGCCNKLGGRGN